MTTMSVVGECFFWYRLTRVVPDKFHRAVKWLRVCVCVCQSRGWLAGPVKTPTNSSYQPGVLRSSVSFWVAIKQQVKYSPSTTCAATWDQWTVEECSSWLASWQPAAEPIPPTHIKSSSSPSYTLVVLLSTAAHDSRLSSQFRVVRVSWCEELTVILAKCNKLHH